MSDNLEQAEELIQETQHEPRDDGDNFRLNVAIARTLLDIAISLRYMASDQIRRER